MFGASLPKEIAARYASLRRHMPGKRSNIDHKLSRYFYPTRKEICWILRWRR